MDNELRRKIIITEEKTGNKIIYTPRYDCTDGVFVSGSNQNHRQGQHQNL